MSKSGSRQFLFVNQDSSSASFSNSRTGPVTYAQISHHVQKSVKRRTPARRKKRIITSTSRLVGWEKARQHDNRDDDLHEESIAIVRREEDLTLHPSLQIDSFCNPTVSMDVDKQIILQYFNEVWMPSKDRIPHGCVVNGFTPIWPKDDQLSMDVVRGAFHSSNEVSIYALLAASTRRMRVVNRLHHPNSYLPDLYALKAIQALRKFIASGEHPSERLVLDISYLGLAEMYVRSPSRSEVYWKLTRDLIVNCGGMGRIAPFTTQAAVAYDLFIAGGTLTAPTLNPFEHPVLVGLNPVAESTSNSTSDIRAVVLNRLQQLDPRIQVLCEEGDYLAQTIKAIRDLPEAAVNGILPYLQDPGSRLYALIAAPLLPSAGRIPKQSATLTCIKADALAAHVRFHAYMIWLWYCALACIGENADSNCFGEPPQIRSEVSKLWKQIDKIYGMLEGSGWAMQDQIVLWISAVGVFVATSGIDRRAYVRLLANAASRLNITSKGKLEGVLDKFLPLDRIHPSASCQLWDLIMENTI